MKRWLNYLGFLGFMGLLGLFTGNPGFYGFFNLFGLWGLSRHVGRERSDELYNSNMARAGLKAFVAAMIALSLAIAAMAIFKTFEAAAIAVAVVFAAEILTFIVSFNYFEKRGNL